jgi:hypothetical protein
VKIDQLIEERQRAYDRIAALETQVEEVLGETGAYPFPAPSLPIAGFDPKAESVTRGGAPAKRGGAKAAADDDGEGEAPAASPAGTPKV